VERGTDTDTDSWHRLYVYVWLVFDLISEVCR